MQRLADGDRSAFDRVFDIAWPPVNRYAKRVLNGAPESDDVSQQALFKVFQQASNYRMGTDALAWILVITSFECKTVKTKARRRKEDYGSEDILDFQASTTEGPEQTLLTKSIDEAIQDALNDLKPEDQETIKIAIHELQRPEVPAATFRKRLERAFDRLRDQWRDHYE